jgi:thiamine-phosphate pyrophosphorylase
MNLVIDFSLYLVTDRRSAGVNSLSDVVKAAINGGVTIVQYREKNASTVEMVRFAVKLHKITKAKGIPLIINDRIDVALAVDAEGLHVGQEDMPAGNARKIIGPGKLLGVSAKTLKEASSAVKDGADYLGVGDIFGTTSKKDAGEPIGLKMLKEISDSVAIPIVGIGGITKANAGSVIESGADGIAVISAIIGRPDPEKEARELMEIIRKRKNKN